ncbi:MAG: toll/interleukin-1 receptor domain-containing protein [Hyphomonas sp.]|uniref:toll/interleukin-1 receptor domain-containing protein n=1 Tax=Hyphomonas sp. TaxID=87 RepID=UPI0017C57E85|nr:toll/interleukin-1 receptor domain-containing protein [Hyphomonas sp.]MBA3069023.1 toll/interleukin-1 receptor domain-containing protein [Hyphomonas sp.]MBU3919070.1 toll/interleukin-1 receptor domain-containing protein [Alphaproteobacteria bacterium]MBU4061656.1 toll/interleukin-1 receptor domain-containing protein [Alphaproteobacteria bacterium]MBU4163501.1 toll/interleukin-1 receptor domain-containing protein [Alphaproteobacteria bacterium]
MKVFISWSGERSKGVAVALRDWIPLVLQYAQPWVSEKDISAGERWALTVASELEASNFGIICVTPENLNSEWLLFESGALSKSMLEGKVIPLLFGLELSDLSGPLSQFQAQKLEQAGIHEVIRSINKVAEKGATQNIIDQLVPSLWPQLSKAIGDISSAVPTGKQRRNQQEILEELVTGVRGLNNRMREIDLESPDRERSSRKRRYRFHPRMLFEISSLADTNEDGPIGLLILASLLREDTPWLADIVAEYYRDIKGAPKEEVPRLLSSLASTIKSLTFHPLGREMFAMSKESSMLVEELPMVIDAVVSRYMERSLRLQVSRIEERDAKSPRDQ